jgi:3-carboxy-cis,cis-muconate cycloisomerase
VSVPALTLSRAGFAHAFGPAAYFKAMLEFESALAEAQAAEGLIPAPAAAAITSACANLRVDADELMPEAKRSVSAAVPLVSKLRAALDRESASHVHFGATSQDVLDTAAALCLKPCLEEADRVLGAAVRALARRAREHRATPMLGRTLLQPAVPITAGLKIARWAMALAQDRDRLSDALAVGLAVQLGGPVGDLATLGAKGPAVRRRMASRLGLADAPAWHVHRNAWIALLGSVAQVTLTGGKIALDLALLSQPEVGEMREAEASEGGRSSAMPHKRNPAACTRALAAAARTPGLMGSIYGGALAEHERALGAWQAELATVPDLVDSLGAVLDFLETIAASLQVDPARMRANLAMYGAGEALGIESERATDVLLDELERLLT